MTWEWENVVIMSFFIPIRLLICNRLVNHIIGFYFKQENGLSEFLLNA